MKPSAQTHRIALQVTLDARVSRVFQALLSPDDLAYWFCLRAETAAHVGGRYQFWGEETIASLYSEGEGGGPIYGLEAGKNLWYTWRIGGADTDVAFYLQADEGHRSRLQLVHQGMAPGLLLMDFWHLRLYALRAMVEGREGPGLFDYRARHIEAVHHELTVAAPAEDVFDALIDAERVGRWMNAQATVDARPGGLYDLGWRDAEGYMAGPQEILDLDPGRALSYRWQFGAEEGVGPEVSWTLIEDRGQTLVTVDHVGFSPDRDNRDYDQGWLQLLWCLKAHVEEGASPIQVLEGTWDL